MTSSSPRTAQRRRPKSRRPFGDALVEYEPRIDVLGVDASAALEDDTMLLVRIDYRVRATNAQSNLVYPFFITEGG